MDTSNLLKQEANKTLEDLHDYSKWKLIVASALTATALELSGWPVGLSPWLLVFVPYACAYIDLNCYQYLLRIFLIAKVLRSSSDDSLLSEYEKQCETYREKGVFGFGLFAQIGSSIIFSIVTLVFAVGRLIIDKIELQNLGDLNLSALPVIWLVGLVPVILCYTSFNKKAKLLEE